MNATLPNAAPRPRRRFLRGFWIFVLLLVVLAALYTWFTLTWSYSDGERAGVLQKFSRKGWLCKTYEGEVALYIVGGMAPQMWHFTVRDAAIADKLKDQVGRRVRLHYTEHVGVPTTCFGDTGYYVDGFEIADVLPPHVVVPGEAVKPAPGG